MNRGGIEELLLFNKTIVTKVKVVRGFRVTRSIGKQRLSSFEETFTFINWSRNLMSAMIGTLTMVYP